MTLAARVLKIAGVGVVIVLALVAILTALRTDLSRSPGVMTDALGPTAGERVDDYLARAADSLVTADDEHDEHDEHDDEALASDPGARRWALVTAGWAWAVPEAVGVVRELPRVSGLYVQVPVDGVAMPVTGVTLAEPRAGETGRDPVFHRGLAEVTRRLEAGPPTGPGVPQSPDAGRAAATAALTVSRIHAGQPAIIGLLARGTTEQLRACLLYTSPSPRDKRQSRMPSSA